MTIPILRPYLPPAARLIPYLEEIDATRFYSNFGLQVRSLERRLTRRYGLGDDTVATVANGTLGLILALAAVEARPGTLCAMPSWTFVASAHAAVTAGLTPYFIDVNLETWALDPAQIEAAIARAPAPVGAVMPVFPFGRPLKIEAWDAFQAKTGIPVVVDAAAAFDSIKPYTVPSVVSLHATKVLGIGEGGFVMSTDPTIARAVHCRSVFGFYGSRISNVHSTNAKLSEYHGAVGNAALDEWPVARGQWMAVAGAYRQAFSRTNRVELQTGFGEDWVSSTLVVKIPDEEALTAAEQALAAAGIETRRWWGMGAHTHPAAASFPRTDLSVTNKLGRTTLALPFSRDLTQVQVGMISDVLLSAV